MARSKNLRTLFVTRTTLVVTVVIAATAVVDVVAARALTPDGVSNRWWLPNWWWLGGLALLETSAVAAVLTVPQRAIRRTVRGLNAMLDFVLAGDLSGGSAVGARAGAVRGRLGMGGEVDALAARVEALTATFRKVVTSSRHAARAVDAAWHDVLEISESMSSTSEVTAAQAAAVATAVEQMALSVHAMATGIDQMAATIHDIAAHAANASDTAHRATEEAEAASSTVDTLSEACRKVDEVVRFINNVAGQTHMLALNATIEAARAGEAGRGFAVVAGEVRELAEATSQATENADRSVTQIQRGSAGAAGAMAAIVESIGKVSQNQSAIAAAVEEQTATTNELGRGAADIASGSNEISRNVAALADVARSTAYGGAQGRTTAAELAVVGEALNTVLAPFRIDVGRLDDGGQASQPAAAYVRDGVTIIENSVRGTGDFELDYRGRWCHSTGNVETDDTNSYSSMPDDVVMLRFSGTALRFYGIKDANHGIAAVSIDGGAEVEVDQFSPSRLAQALLFTSGRLAPGEHVAKIRVTGRKHHDSRYVWVTVDRIEIDR
jgi:methyl-accepting chemotaxis protein